MFGFAYWDYTVVDNSGNSVYLDYTRTELKYTDPSYVSMDMKMKYDYLERDQYNINDCVVFDLTCTNKSWKNLINLDSKFIITRPDGNQLVQEAGIHTAKELSKYGTTNFLHGYKFGREDMGGILKIKWILTYQIESTGEIKTEEKTYEFNTAEREEKEEVGDLFINMHLMDVEEDSLIPPEPTTFYIGLFSDPDRCDLIGGPYEVTFDGCSSTTIRIPLYEGEGPYYVGLVEWCDSEISYNEYDQGWTLQIVGMIDDVPWEPIYDEGYQVDFSGEWTEATLNIEIMYYDIPEGY